MVMVLSIQSARVIAMCGLGTHHCIINVMYMYPIHGTDVNVSS